MKKMTGLKMMVLGLMAAGAMTATASAQTGESQPEKVSPLIVLGTSQVSNATFGTFLPVLMNDIIHSRDEKNNISFELFTPEDGTPDMLSVERWTDRAGFDAHLAYPYVQTFIEKVPSALRKGGTQSALFMRDLSPVPEQAIPSPQTTRNSLTVFMIKPTALASVIDATLKTAEAARATHGNLRYDVFQDISQPRRLAIFQRWVSSDALEAWNLQDAAKSYEAFLADSRETPASPQLWRPVKDIGR
ncbi:putative quinol monooxygenase [Pantoea cypripedii]|uniref:ABM domain-containing protein n=1 Tax=Pantoea cypripedii TaxID=55209 RepID=A0A6B9G9A2_PANCY|nr:antibiotic biosynthesis monooxygenase [Pantoea cypripedii]QGY32433.1 hypothetical protein CUN67_26015 [Pantoea cypripedii]